MPDKNHVLCQELDIGVTVQTLDSTNIIDLGTGGQAANENLLELQIWISETVTSSGSATVQFILADCDTVGGSYRSVFTTPAFVFSTIVASKERPLFAFGLPSGVLGIQEFVKLQVVIAGATTTAGKLSAFLAPRAV